ncbi:flavodoxin [Neptuniibacter halophilus]|uniref:flavodoxin n=1 Tax=Neptuniibacter halophilus TaxID=651666 RepID=UPI002573FA80|nr:flavodoxin [Neptuniibacter halophilus]
MAHIKILLGTVYGNAQEVAESAQTLLQALGHQVQVLRQPAYAEVVTEDADVLLVCTSTTGQGELPDSLLPLYVELRDRFPLLPDVRFGLIGLGDSSYDEFAGGGRLMLELLQELQLKQVGEPLWIDACETMNPWEEAEPWLQGWSEQLRSA